MADHVLIHPAAAQAIRTLHGEIERLAVRAASSVPLPGPIGITDNGIGEEMVIVLRRRQDQGVR